MTVMNEGLLNLTVVPGKRTTWARSGIHKHRPVPVSRAGAPAIISHQRRWLWIPACAGMTAESLVCARANGGV